MIILMQSILHRNIQQNNCTHTYPKERGSKANLAYWARLIYRNHRSKVILHYYTPEFL